MLLLISACSVLFLILSLAVRGQLWAVATSIGLGSLVLTFLVFALFFQVAFILAKLTGMLRGKERPVSPFAEDTAPPTYVAPSNPIE